MGSEAERILIVDDSPDTLEVLGRNLSGAGYVVFTAGSVEEALRVLAGPAPDLVVTDMKMPRATGMDLVRHVRNNLRDTEVMVITGYPSVEGAVEAIKGGAEEYLTKPFTDEELLGAVRQCLDKLGMRRELRAAEEQRPDAPFGLIGSSPAMRRVATEIEKAARTNATVLISGESGTGKELVARAIHYQSKRAAAPFVAVNCGGIPEGLLESELFGHVKGAFTGASESRAGFFLTADGGTLFLDEVSETSLAMQTKLLRALQEREICMVGSARPRPVDVRVICATNKELQQLVARGQFRQDLYFRVNVIAIQLPPLRERPSDVLELLRHFVARYAAENGRPVPEFTPAALHALTAHAWPGNVRELENTVQRLLVMCDGPRIDVPDLPSLMRYHADEGPADLTRPLAEVEAEYIRRVLQSVRGNKQQAARILGIDRKTLRLKLKREAGPGAAADEESASDTHAGAAAAAPRGW